MCFTDYAPTNMPSLARACLECRNRKLKVGDHDHDSSIASRALSNLHSVTMYDQCARHADAPVKYVITRQLTERH